MLSLVCPYGDNYLKEVMRLVDWVRSDVEEKKVRIV